METLKKETHASLSEIIVSGAEIVQPHRTRNGAVQQLRVGENKLSSFEDLSS